jgi:hypothetical protein
VLSEAQLGEVPEYLQDQPEGDAPAAEVPRSSALRFARMSGSSIAGRDAAAWVTDFLNAAYLRRWVLRAWAWLRSRLDAASGRSTRLDP